MRSQIIGMILGSMALGVLLGYPFGGILYAFSGKSAPFYIIAAMTFVILGEFWTVLCQVFLLKNENNHEKNYFELKMKLAKISYVNVCLWKLKVNVIFFSSSTGLHGFIKLQKRIDYKRWKLCVLIG